MTAENSTPKAYLDSLPVERRQVVSKIRSSLRKHLPKGFKESMGSNMLGYVVPKTLYPNGYHVNPKQPLPFINLASQKSFVALYHMGIYADKQLMRWFQSEYPKHCQTKLDMGKSCIRFKKMDDIPYALIDSLAGKMSVEDWIALYEKSIKK
ncbi:MAG: DUF1801 domain-containing protein [Gammaproteobacteria bacterium]|nr:DUF1801 domain-containing protein [Gammaproteobacteria bacterium]